MPTHFLKYPSLTNQYAIGKSRDLLRVSRDAKVVSRGLANYVSKNKLLLGSTLEQEK